MIAASACAMGLSPRVRGNQASGRSQEAAEGSIPAGAGEPASSSGCCSRGTGLSPRVRGNPRGVAPSHPRPGSIPAGAGEPGTPGPARIRIRVYPRGCGGTASLGGPLLRGLGLSPRVRGNPRPASVSARLKGSIPAGAGEPTLPRGLAGSRRVYPRGCGGTRLTGIALDNHLGLSPRVRGNRRTSRLSRIGQGSIPAGAGEPALGHIFFGRGGVYPRGCGGTRLAGDLHGEQQGLSPRVRGNRPGARCGSPRSGSIPAGAGEPRIPTGRRWLAGVYPRGCGGTIGTRSHEPDNWGLSPRVRGNQFLLHEVVRVPGSIPAGAGEPTFRYSLLNSLRVYPRGCGGTLSPTTFHSGR